MKKSTAKTVATGLKGAAEVDGGRRVSGRAGSNHWFVVDKAGLAALTARREKAFVLAELLSNSWDADGVTCVTVTTTPVPGRAEIDIRIEDDSPNGFANLADAFTLFAHTDKRGNAQQRGRFSLGEKLTLAIAREARITSTRGTVIFKGSQRTTTRARRQAGSEVLLRIPMTRDELDRMLARARVFIAPVPTALNGEAIPVRTPLAVIHARLPTELQGDDGSMRRTERATEIAVYPAATGEGWLYELGIPVCATGDTFDVDIRQKVPLSLERESVTDVYLRRVRSAVVAHAAHLLDAGAAQSSWVGQALEATDLPADAVRAVMEQRFGEKAVIHDPSDPEANKIAVARGYTVVHGGSFSAAAWESIRKSQALRPAGQVTPSPKPWAEGGRVVAPIDPNESQQRFAQWCQRMGRVLLDAEIQVEFYQRFNDPFACAAYGKGRLQFSVGRLGKAWFDGPVMEKHLDLLLHEFGHHYESDHLSRKFSDALTHLGAKLAMAVRADPGLLDLVVAESTVGEGGVPALAGRARTPAASQS